MNTHYARYYVNSSQVRYERRFYWIMDRTTEKMVDYPGHDRSTNKRAVERLCEKLNQQHLFDTCKITSQKKKKSGSRRGLP